MTTTTHDPTDPVHWMDPDQDFPDMPVFTPNNPDNQLTVATALGICTKYHVVLEGFGAGPSDTDETTISVVATSEGPVVPARCIRRYRVENRKHLDVVVGIACRWMLETALAEVAMESLW